MKKKLLLLAFFILIGSLNVLKAQVLGVREYYNSILDKHFYTTDINNLGPSGKNGWVYSRNICSLGPPNLIGRQNVYSFYNPSTSGHYHSTNPTPPPGYQYINIMGSVLGIPYANIIPIYQYHNSTHDFYYSIFSTPPNSTYVSDGIAYYSTPSY